MVFEIPGRSGKNTHLEIVLYEWSAISPLWRNMFCNIVLFSINSDYMETSGSQAFIINGKIFEEDDSFIQLEM